MTPRITPRQAIEIAKNANADKEKRPLPLNPLNYQDETSLLGVWKDDSGKVRLVYEVSFMQHGKEPSKPYYLIDANTKEILKYFDSLLREISNANSNATGPGGNGKIGKYYYGTDRPYLRVFQLGNTCIMGNLNFRIIDMASQSQQVFDKLTYLFTCPNNTYKEVNGAYSPINDAYYNMTVTLNMYKDWFGLLPTGKEIPVGVHFGQDYFNAFWHNGGLFVGDGDFEHYPLTVLDVMAHEVSHGFTAQHSNLYYEFKSGGLNESFSDMAGQAAEYYHDASNDWQVGAQITKATGKALRYMSNPPLDGISIDNQSKYDPDMNPHFSSGVFNKAFYLLATTSGWDVKKAFGVYLRANMLYWSANVDWDAAGNGVMDAACDLGYDTQAVQKSLAQVGVTSNISPGATCLLPPEPPKRPTGPQGLIFDADGNGLMEIYTAEDLNNMRYNLAGTRWKTSASDVGSAVGCPASGCNGYELATNIDLANTQWDDRPSSTYKGSTKVSGGWEPIGIVKYPFRARFEGRGFEIRNLYINRYIDCEIGGVGLFGVIDKGSALNQVALSSVAVTGFCNTGGLAGTAVYGSIANSHVTGSVTGSTETGGLVGYNFGSNVINSYSTGSVTGTSDGTGGLIGAQFTGSISNSYSTSSVTGTTNSSTRIGGLVGSQHSSSIINSYATGSVRSSPTLIGALIGGLVGAVSYGSITNSYATGSVIGAEYSTYYIGGLIGYQEYSINNMSNNYWDTQSTGQATSFGIGSLGGLTTSQMRLLSTLGPCFKLAYVRYPQLYTSPCTTQILLGGPNTN